MKVRLVCVSLFLTASLWASAATESVPDSPETPDTGSAGDIPRATTGMDQAYQALEAWLHAQADRESAERQREMTFDIQELDSRLILPACDSLPAVEGTLSLNRKRQTFAVRCPGSWTVRIPVDVSVMAPVMVSARPLFRGQALTESVIRWEARDLTRLSRGFVEQSQDWQDMRIRRTIGAGTVITPSGLQPPLLISKGDRVIIEAGNDRFFVKMVGEALSNGVKGQQIPVRNLTSSRVVRAEVVARQKVRIRL